MTPDIPFMTSHLFLSPSLFLSLSLACVHTKISDLIGWMSVLFLPHADICVKETMSLADSLYNLQLIQDFCRENLNNCCHFTLEDMFYASSCFKVRRNDCVCRYFGVSSGFIVQDLSFILCSSSMSLVTLDLNALASEMQGGLSG